MPSFRRLPALLGDRCCRGMSDAAPTGSTTIDNSAWSGAKTAYLGMSVGSPQYRANHAGVVLTFDEFDSRRQTFIGQ